MSIISFEVAKEGNLGFEDAVKDVRRLIEACEVFSDVVFACLTVRNCSIIVTMFLSVGNALKLKRKKKPPRTRLLKFRMLCVFFFFFILIIEQARKKEASTKQEYKRVSKKVKLELKVLLVSPRHLPNPGIPRFEAGGAHQGTSYSY